MIDQQQTLGELVTALPATAKILHQYGLDFCCGGNRTLVEACEAEHVDTQAVLRALANADTEADESVNWAQRPIKDLIQHILKQYHEPLRMELPRLIDLAQKVVQAHADKPDCPKGLANLLSTIQEAVESHLGKEEKILFPLILTGRAQTAYMPAQVMMEEHEDHGRNLRRIRGLTNDLTLPDHACVSWGELYRSLAALEADLMEHIHLENNILFPRALAF